MSGSSPPRGTARHARWLLPLVLLLGGMQWWTGQHGVAAQHGRTADVAQPRSARPDAAPPTGVARTDARVQSPALPVETDDTLQRIGRGGPFPFDRDGAVFGNFEHRLPQRPRAYYHEFTVITPGAHNRGTRRIIAGGQPPTEFYYTGDHYQTFTQVRGVR